MTVTSKWVALHEVSDYLAKGWREVQIKRGRIGCVDKAALMVSPEEPASEPAKVEPATAISPHGVWRCECCAEIADPMDPRFRWNGECWQHHHAEAQTHFDCRFFGPQPEPVAAYHAAPMMGFPCANCGQETLRMDGHVSHRASGDETEYYCDKLSRPEPVAAEMPPMPNAVHNLVLWSQMLAASQYGSGFRSQIQTEIEAFTDWWRTHAAQPAKARMTEELERVLDAAEIAEEQARVAWVIQTPRSRTLKADIAAVRAHAAEAGTVEDDAESFVWRRGYETGLIDASRPARVRMTDELERLMEAARARAWDCHASGNMSRCEDIRADIAAVRSQAAEAGKGSRKILSEALVASQLRVEQLEAEAGKVRLPNVRELFEHVQHYPMTVNGREILRLAIKEADAAEGRK